MTQQILIESNVWQKLKNIESNCHRILRGAQFEIPINPGRDVEILPIRELPPKRGLSFADGQGRLLHNLASIELQAMELAIRTLSEFPEAPQQFREELAVVAIEEAKHLRLCVEALEEMRQPWGSYPTHLGLWQCVSGEDSLIDRILIVHRYLEGSGLDASDQLLRRLSGIKASNVSRVVSVIAHDEVGHVQFGSRWYKEICKLRGIDPETDFRKRLFELLHRIPRRLDKINSTLREKAGFSADEIVSLNEVREFWLAKPEERIHSGPKNATGLLSDSPTSGSQPEPV